MALMSCYGHGGLRTRRATDMAGYGLSDLDCDTPVSSISEA